MNEKTTNPRSSMQDLLSKVSRYEALFELTGEINVDGDIEPVGQHLAHRLKYISDVYAWRYICFDGDPEDSDGPDAIAIVIDGHRGQAKVMRTSPDKLSDLEMEIWRNRKTRIFSGDAMTEALEQLPDHFQKPDLEQISANVLVENSRTQALFFFCKRRQPFSELDLKCLSMVCGFVHHKVLALWEHRKLRDLELAYLQQEVTLRQNDRLATLGRLSAGMAHELNNPAAVARQGTEQLRDCIAQLEQAQFALGEANLTDTQRELMDNLETEALRRSKQPGSLDPITRSDLDQEVEDWLEQAGVDEPWQHASMLVTMGLCVTELSNLTTNFDAVLTPVVIVYFSSKFTAYTLLEEIGHGTRRITEIIKALKGYSYMDQAPVQAVNVCEGLNDTLVMLSSKLRDGIRVDLDFAENLPLIQGYGSELNQVWTNLIDNAISVMDSDGELNLRTYQEDDWLVVEVADNGPGIPAENQTKIFDPFYTTKAPGEGTGLGLNISHGIIVEKHGGQISVDSKPGATRFIVKIPIANHSITTNEEDEDSADQRSQA
jgi:signal transduction histidine kinase